MIIEKFWYGCININTKIFSTNRNGTKNETKNSSMSWNHIIANNSIDKK